MRHKQIAIFKFSELSEESQERAMQKYAENFGYNSCDDAMDSINALAKHFGGKMVDYAVDWFASSHSFARFDMPEMNREEIAALLSQLGSFNAKTLKGDGECKLTGYCADEDAIDGFREAFHGGENDLGELMEAAFDSWLKAGQRDCEAFYTVEEFTDHADANEYEYTEDGRMA